jgi:hypothetical protein
LLRASMFTIDGFMQSKRKRFSQKISHNWMSTIFTFLPYISTLNIFRGFVLTFPSAN